jgi:hypothetical protein
VTRRPNDELRVGACRPGERGRANTSSPTAKRVTPGNTCSTTPETSHPGVNGGFSIGKAPDRNWSGRCAHSRRGPSSTWATSFRRDGRTTGEARGSRGGTLWRTCPGVRPPHLSRSAGPRYRSGARPGSPARRRFEPQPVPYRYRRVPQIGPTPARFTSDAGGSP